MKSTPAFLMRGLVALTSILLVAGLAFGQDYTSVLATDLNPLILEYVIDDATGLARPASDSE